MKLSIVTINYNDAVGLRKTLESVAMQRSCDCEVEHIVIDGGSTDNSVDTIKQYPHVSKWISERDKGVYDGMNKGIRLATGDYIQILNSGDILASDHVIEDCRLKIGELGYPEMMCGNMLKQMPNGKIIRDDNGRCEDLSFFRFFTATLNHDCLWIKRDLFDRFGLYDENLKIVSDWKWYLQVIVLACIKPVYVNIDMTIFDMTGISERNIGLRNKEREQVLREIMQAAIYEDYAARKFDIEQMNRLHRYPLAYKMVWFIERILFKLEKWHILK